MGFYDRDYYRNSPGSRPVPMWSMWSVTTWLIVINVAVFVVEQVVVRATHHDALFRWGAFQVFLAIQHVQLWRFLTFQFLHGGLWHILFNMMSLYWFGPMVEAYLGGRRYLIFYLLCGMAGAACFTALTMFGISSPYAGLVGASAGIMGVLVAGGTRVAPDVTVMLMFPPIPMKLRTMAWVLVGIAAYTAITNGNNAGGEAAHLGGAALGYLLIQYPNWLDPIAAVGAARRKRRGGYRLDDWR